MATSLKKPKKPEPPKVNAGAIQAPKSAAKGPNLSRAQNLNPTTGKLNNDLNSLSKSSGNSGPGSGGAAPGLPSLVTRAPGLPPAESPATHNARQDATNAWLHAQQEDAHSKYMAALKYGDLTAANLWGKSYADLTGGQWSPLAAIDTGELQEIDKAEKANQFRNKIGHNENNTFFSSLNREDIGNIEQDAANSRVKAKQNYDDSITNFTFTLTDAKEAFDIAIREADEADLKAELEREKQAFDAWVDGLWNMDIVQGSLGGGGGPSPSTIATPDHPISAKGFTPVAVGNSIDLSKKKKK